MEVVRRNAGPLAVVGGAAIADYIRNNWRGYVEQARAESRNLRNLEDALAADREVRRKIRRPSSQSTSSSSNSGSRTGTSKKSRTLKRRYMPKYRRAFKRRRTYRRKPKKRYTKTKAKLRGTRKSRFGRVKKYGPLFSATPPPIGKVSLVHKNAAPYNLSLYAKTTTSGVYNEFVKSWVFRTNDVVHPVDNERSFFDSDASVHSLNQWASNYKRHQVNGFRQKGVIRYKMTDPSYDLSTATSTSAKATPLLNVFLAWRILDEVPTDMNPTPKHEVYQRVVEGQEPGWRYRRVAIKADVQGLYKYDTGYISADKFYKRPWRSDWENTENYTEGPSTSWRSPANFTFIQFVFFVIGYDHDPQQPGQTLQPTASNVGTATSISQTAWNLQATLEQKSYYWIKSYDRAADKHDSSLTNYAPPVVSIEGLASEAVTAGTVVHTQTTLPE